MDRNQAVKQQFAQAQQRREFIAAVASGQTGAYDKEKTLLKAGQLVIWNMPPDIMYWLVKDIGPALDLPQAALRVTLTITVPVILQPGVRMGNLLVVGNQDGQDPGALARDTIAGDESAKPEGTADPPAGDSQEQEDGADAIGKPTSH